MIITDGKQSLSVGSGNMEMKAKSIQIEPDPVNHPSHYTSGYVECIDAIQSALTEEEFRGYCKGNAIKYTWRERSKGSDEDLRKANWYLKRITEE